MKFSIKESAVTFTEDILNGELYFLCSEKSKIDDKLNLL